MDPLDQLDTLAKRLSSLIPEPLQATQQDIESNLRSGLESGLRKMNLVTREEFDVQSAVLLRTREKLEQLEKRVAEMEAYTK
jgi:BMFP domain-containing protein YqiC